jgi:hypothetical protein
MIAAALLVVLALLVMATPLVRSTGGGRTGAYAGGFRSFNPQGYATPQGGFTPGQGFPGSTSSGGTSTNPYLSGGSSTNPNYTGRRFSAGSSSLFRIAFLNGIEGTIIYTFLLLISLAAALGMFMTKTWGKILGIVMGIVYAVLALVSTLPLLLSGFISRLGSGSLGLTLGLNILHLVLAIAVIVLAVIPAKKILVPITPDAPPAPPAAAA